MLLDDDVFNKAYTHLIRGAAEPESLTVTAAERQQYSEMLYYIADFIHSLQAEQKELDKARKLRQKYFDTLGSGALSLLSIYHTLDRHNVIKYDDEESVILWAYWQGVRSERAKRH